MAFGLALAFASSARADVIPCSQLAAGGPAIEISGDENRFSGPCEVTLANDLTIRGDSGARIDLTPSAGHPFGLIIHSNGHRVEIDGVEMTFDHGFAVDIMGEGMGQVIVRNSRIVDTRSSTVACSQSDRARFGLILHRVGAVQLEDFHVEGAAGAARVQGGVVLVGHAGDPPATASWSGGKSIVECGLAAEAVRRPLMLGNVLVQEGGPCDLRPKGLSEVVEHGRPLP
jgi:hypothetical protein